MYTEQPYWITPKFHLVWHLNKAETGDPGKPQSGGKHPNSRLGLRPYTEPFLALIYWLHITALLVSFIDFQLEVLQEVNLYLSCTLEEALTNLPRLDTAELVQKPWMLLLCYCLIMKQGEQLMLHIIYGLYYHIKFLHRAHRQGAS